MINTNKNFHIFYDEKNNIFVYFPNKNKTIKICDNAENATVNYGFSTQHRNNYIRVNNILYKILDNDISVEIKADELYCEDFIYKQSNSIIYKQNDRYYLHNLVSYKKTDITESIINKLKEINDKYSIVYEQNFIIGDERFLITFETYNSYRKRCFGIFDINQRKWFYNKINFLSNVHASYDFLNGLTNLFAVKEEDENNVTTYHIFYKNKLIISTLWDIYRPSFVKNFEIKSTTIIDKDTKYIAVYDSFKNKLNIYQIINHKNGKIKKIYQTKNVDLYYPTSNKYFVMYNVDDNMLFLFDVDSQKIIKYIPPTILNRNIIYNEIKPNYNMSKTYHVENEYTIINQMEFLHKTQETNYNFFNNIGLIQNVISLKDNLFIVAEDTATTKQFIRIAQITDNEIIHLSEKFNALNTEYSIDRENKLVCFTEKNNNVINIYLYDLENNQKHNVFQYNLYDNKYKNLPSIPCYCKQISSNLVFIRLENSFLNYDFIIYDKVTQRILFPMDSTKNIIISPLLHKIWNCFIYKNALYDKHGQKISDFNIKKEDYEKLQDKDKTSLYKYMIYPDIWRYIHIKSKVEKIVDKIKFNNQNKNNIKRLKF